MGNKIQFVDRSNIRTSQERLSKFTPLIDALDKIKPDGKAVQVYYNSDKEVGSMRTTMYMYNNENNVKIRSEKDSQNGKVNFIGKNN